MRHEAIFRSMVQKTQILSVVQAAVKDVQYDRHMLLCRVCWCVFLASHAPQDEFTKFTKYKQSKRYGTCVTPCMWKVNEVLSLPGRKTNLVFEPSRAGGGFVNCANLLEKAASVYTFGQHYRVPTGDSQRLDSSVRANLDNIFARLNRHKPGTIQKTCTFDNLVKEAEDYKNISQAVLGNFVKCPDTQSPATLEAARTQHLDTLHRFKGTSDECRGAADDDEDDEQATGAPNSESASNSEARVAEAMSVPAASSSSSEAIAVPTVPRRDASHRCGSQRTTGSSPCRDASQCCGRLRNTCQ